MSVQPNTPKPAIKKIDIDAVLRERLGSRYRFVPRPLVALLKRVVCQDSLNDLLDKTGHLRDAEFCRAVLRELGITYGVVHPERLPAPADRRVIFVSNHPLGGLDGMVLIDLLTSLYGPGLKFVVNDLLMAIDQLKGVFLPVNKLGKQSRDASDNLTRALEGPDPLVIFPAGLVSRRGANGAVADLEWHKMFINKAIASRRDIVPLFFSGRNSNFFYNFAYMRRRIGLRFNVEMALLPAEVFKQRSRNFTIVAGPRVPWDTLSTGSRAAADAREIKDRVYSLENETDRDSLRTNNDSQ